MAFQNPTSTDSSKVLSTESYFFVFLSQQEEMLRLLLEEASKIFLTTLVNATSVITL